ncbi:MAG: hypothetical protein O7A68_04135, partial [Alphaproteobacteria bacterium]|nr:hypothetical protein [Alphaproteobacteria bacterium]
MGDLVAERRRRRVVTMVAGTVLLVTAVALSLPRQPATSDGEFPVEPAKVGDVPAVEMGDARMTAALVAALAQVSPPAPLTPGLRPGSQTIAALNPSLDVQRVLTARRDIHRLTPEDIQRCLEVAREVDPQLARRLADLRRESPGPAFERAIAGARYLRALANLKQRDPQLYNVKIMELQTDANIDGLLQEFRELRRDGIASQGLEARLHALVRVQVVYLIAARGMALRRLNEHVQKVTDKLAEDSKDFEKTVEHRLAELLEQVGAAPGQNAPVG